MYDWSVDASAGSMITGLSDLSAPGNSGRETTLTRPHWQPGEVIEVIDQTPDAVTLRLRLPEPTEFLPGQYYNVRLAAAGRTRPVQRSYSVSSSPFPDASVIDLGIREIPDGLVSPRLVRGLSSGDRVDVRGPAGRFTWTEADGGPLLLVGAGSGVVPLVSIVRYAAASALTIPMRLVCSSVNFESALYREDLARLADSCGWLEVVQSFTRDPDDLRAGHHRRVDRAMLAEALDGQFPRWVYLCGPPLMVEATGNWLVDLGVDPGAIRCEKYD
ncbi:MAG: oxidoreductase [Acidimicrobiales bacterium]|nr:MAG: oxidoreductase [Acidimicrobiales bacterium]